MEHTGSPDRQPRRRRRGRLSAALVGSIALVVAFAGCAGGSSGGGETVKIGLAAPLTGVLGAVGTQQRDAVELAVQEANDSGRLGAGVRVELVEQDTKADQAATIAATEKLLSGGATAIIGGTTTSEAAVIKPRSSKAGVPFFVLSSLDPTMAEAGVAFRAAPLPASPGSVTEQAAQLLGKMNLKTAYLGNTVDNDGQKSDAASWASYLQKNGVEVLGTAGVNTGDTNFAGPVAQIVDARPDLVVVSMLPGQDAGFVKALRDRGYAGKIASYTSLSTPAAYQLAGDTLAGTYVATVFQPQAQIPATQEFVESFTAKYGQTPTYLNAIGYAAATLLLDSLANAGDKGDPASLAKAASAVTTADTVYGPVRMEKAQAFVDGELPMAVWAAGGKLVPWRGSTG
jgi:branched-chain amino acid transport system substrate-binding protein